MFMKKLLLLLTTLFVIVSSQAKCDFSRIIFENIHQKENQFYFMIDMNVDMNVDDCWSYQITSYDYQLNKLDTLDDWCGFINVRYNPGKHQIRLKVSNDCLSRDTILTINIDTKSFSNKPVKPVIKNQEIKIVGYYNMMGEQVYYLEPNKIYIVHYNNGYRQKIMKREL